MDTPEADTPLQLYLVRVERGGPWDWSRGLREQDGRDEHARFMNGLVDDGLTFWADRSKTTALPQVRAPARALRIAGR